MPTSPTLPDAELLVRTYLDGVAAVTGLLDVDAQGNEPIYTVTPKPAPTGRFVRLFRLGGPPRARRGIDTAVIQVEAYGGTKAQARELAAECSAALDDIEDGSHADGSVSGSSSSSFRYLPDSDLMTARNAARERYIATVDLTIRAART